jgi:hypothetical protein
MYLLVLFQVGLDYWPHLKLLPSVSDWINYHCCCQLLLFILFSHRATLMLLTFYQQMHQGKIILLLPFQARLDWWPHLDIFFWVSDKIKYYYACHLLIFILFSHHVTIILFTFYHKIHQITMSLLVLFQVRLDLWPHL